MNQLIINTVKNILSIENISSSLKLDSRSINSDPEDELNHSDGQSNNDFQKDVDFGKDQDFYNEDKCFVMNRN